MPAKVKIRKVGNLNVAAVTGKVTSEDAISISKKLEALVKKDGATTAVDLSGIDYIDSHWLGVFVYTWKLFKENNKELVFVIPQGFIFDLFRNSNLDKAFKIVATLDALVKA